MEGLSLSEGEQAPTVSRDDFHLKMAVVFDLAFAIFAEKRFLIFEELNE